MVRSNTILIIPISMILAAGTGCSSTARTIDPRADQALCRMSSTLQNAREFSFHVREVVDEPLETGQLAQFSNARRVFVRRPNKAFIDRRGDHGNRSVWYNGRTLTVLDKSENTYAVIDVPDTIEKMLDFLIEEYDLTIPLADLMFRKPYDTLIANVELGSYVGLEKIDKYNCHHLAFQQEVIDWQIWIDDGDIPMPRKLSITQKQLPGEPHYAATWDEWNLSPRLSDKMFEFQAPADAEQVEMDVLLGIESE